MLRGDLEQRKPLIRKPNDKVRCFVISSVEAPPRRRAGSRMRSLTTHLRRSLGSGSLPVTNYTLESLEERTGEIDSRSQ